MFSYVNDSAENAFVRLRIRKQKELASSNGVGQRENPACWRNDYGAGVLLKGLELRCATGRTFDDARPTYVYRNFPSDSASRPILDHSSKALHVPGKFRHRVPPNE